MAKMDKEFLMKHHFWVLLLPFALFALIAWFGLMSEVSGAADEKLEAITKHENALKSAKAQPKKLIELYADQVKTLVGSKTKMWEKAWDSQKDIYTWPENFTDDQRGYLYQLRFGDEVKSDIIRQQFRNDEKYRHEFEQLAEKLAPMQFNGGWEAVLRHVRSWTVPPTSEEIWLALEDYWIQRELLSALNQVNIDASKFQRGADPKDTPLRRKFASRLWDIELWVEKDGKGDANVIKGTIKNRTERLQALGIGNRMILKVWLDPDAGEDEYVEFPVEGEFLAGGKSEPIRAVPEHKLDRAVRVVEFVKVEQIFDQRTVPVKRVDRIELGKASDRHFGAQAQLKMTTFSDKEYQASSGAAKGTTETTSPMIGIAAPMPGSMRPGGDGFGQDSNADPTATANGLVRKRYLDKTDQVRRMSVGLLVVADQDFLHDVLVAMANSRLRFQNTQFHWNRFHGQIAYGTDPGTTVPGGSPSVPGPGNDVPDIGPIAPKVGSGRPGSSGFFGPRPGVASPMPLPMGTGPGSNSGGDSAGRSQDQLSASLVEVAVYGIASLYEPFKGEKGATTAPKPPPAPEPSKTKTAEPKKSPATKTPMTKKVEPKNEAAPTPKEVAPTPMEVTPSPKGKEPAPAPDPKKTESAPKKQ